MSDSLRFVLIKNNSNKFNKALVFDLDTYKFIRNKYNIVGKFIGILTDFKQQYNICNLPCEINILEIYWLINQISNDEIKLHLYYNSNQGIEIETYDFKEKENNKNHLLIPFKNNYSNSKDNTESLIKELKTQLDNDLDYKFYSYLKTKFKSKDNNQIDQYPCLLSGLKFGGIYNLYLKDPLTIHSKYIVKNYIHGKNQSIPLVQLQSDIRLGSSTKKEVLVTFLNEDDLQFESYSFQWAGF